MYMIERLGDIHGKTYHGTLDEALNQLAEEYPKPETIKEHIASLIGGEYSEEKAKAIMGYLKDMLYVDDYLPSRLTPDPEDDRILIWDITDEPEVVWHFSGWHWDFEASDVVQDGLAQGTLPGDHKSLYQIALEET